MSFARVVLPLTVASFASGTQAYVFAGLLGDMARDLGVTIGAAGQLATAYAVTFALAAPAAASLAARFERRQVLVLALVAVAVINAIAAATPAFAGLIGLRIAAGFAATFILPVASGAAITLAPADARGRALALVAGGTSVAFMLGIPVGSAIGGAFGWRATFVFAALLALASAFVVRFGIPRVAPQPRPTVPLAQILRRPAVASALASIFVGFAATFTVVAYIGPVVSMTTGATGGGVGLYQLCVGLGSLIGVPLGGALVDKGYARAIPLGVFGVMTLTLSTYSALLAGMFTASAPLLLALVILAGAAALFTLIPSMQAQLVASAPDAAPLLLGVSGSVMFLGQGAGALFGGLVTDHLGFAAIGVAGATVAIAGVALTLAGATKRRAPVQPIVTGESQAI